MNYSPERCTNLAAWGPFTPLLPGIPGQPGPTRCTDTKAAGASPLFYRVGVGS
ncbi:MAG: hypothetical protein ABSG59_23710 [Verrucomicrobiota bacterium]